MSIKVVKPTEEEQNYTEGVLVSHRELNYYGILVLTGVGDVKWNVISLDDTDTGYIHTVYVNSVNLETIKDNYVVVKNTDNYDVIVKMK